MNAPSPITAAGCGIDDRRLEPLCAWLLGEGAHSPSLAALLQGFSEQLVKAGVPLARSSLHVQALHSVHIGITNIWRRGKKVEELLFPHGARQDPRFLHSPLKAVYDSGEWLELRLTPEVAGRFNIIPDLLAEGMTHYLIAPMPFSIGTANSISWASDAPEGFPEKDLALLRALEPVLRAALELRSLHRSFHDVLHIYAGRGPSQRILAGEVRRGEVHRIQSAMLFCDLRDFTALSGQLRAEALVALLNDFFDCVVPAVVSRAGEILKFLGDGVIAIFPAGEPGAETVPDRVAALCCATALEAAQAIEAAVADYNARQAPNAPPLRMGASLHYGSAAYGNIGSGERLDFTVIGRAVNLTSRLNALCGELDEPILMSETFARLAATPARRLGAFELKGIEGKVQALAPEREGKA